MINKILADAKGAFESAGGEGIGRLEKTGTDLDITVILNSVYAVAAVVAVAFIVFGGVQYSMTQGDPGKVRKAGQTIAFAVIGLAIVILATVFTNFVFTSV